MECLFKITIYLSVLCLGIQGYKPVVFMHGILAQSTEADQMFGWIKQNHPGTQTTSLNMYNGATSVENMMKQVGDITVLFENVTKQHPDGVHLICFSQGGLVCRAILEQTKHNVDTFISLSSPQSGQFGDTVYTKFLFPNLLRDNVYKLAYTPLGQNISVGNYWNDPRHQDLYKNSSKFLAVINNDTYNGRSEEFKSNFIRLKKLVMIGGPDDGVITPWQSSHFGFYDKQLDIVEMKNQKWYTDDSFGLQTLDKRNATATHVIPGVHHTHWHSNYSVFQKYILPYLT